MKKGLKKILGFFLATCMLVGMSMTTYASENENQPEAGDIVDGSMLIKEDYSESILYNPARGNILNRGAARISEIGSGQINAYGAVMPAVKCDTLRLEMTVQRLVGGSWANVKSYSDISYNASLLAKSYNCSVTKGYYYRVKAACIATKGGTTETQMPVTNGIWIG
ncbi:MAG TPA: hypothetical protein H9914_02845 [Candidatus Blautia avicola]|uniref:Uncharacterized protein n=1 Tax=Candidatus Blautia avicola TaxID=2838483 RepID=A0A9D2TWC7_9FIRM|nr:hypothetical protein [Candidatus Blautia avicola]